MKKVVKILLVIIIIVVIGFLCFLLQRQKNKNVELENKTAQLENRLNDMESQKDESNNTEQSNISNNTTKNDENTAKEAIKKALKDNEWLKNNIYVDELAKYYEESGKENWIEDAKQCTNFIEMESTNKNPIVILVYDIPWAGQIGYFITYSNGSVKVEEIIRFDYSEIRMNPETKTILVEDANLSEQYVYRINSNKLEKIAESKLNMDDETLTYYIDNKSVSYEKYQKYIEGCEKASIQLTNANVDKYIK